MEKKKENWKIIKGFNKFYEVSDLGNVRSYRVRRTGKRKSEPSLLSGGLYRTKKYNKLPYRFFLLTDDNGKKHNIKACVLVLKAFVGPRPKDFEASHKNGKCQNDRLTNLLWETKVDNQKRMKIHKKRRKGVRVVKSNDEVKMLIRKRDVSCKQLSERNAREIRLYMRQGATVRELASIFKTPEINIKNVVDRKTFKNAKILTHKQVMKEINKKQREINKKQIAAILNKGEKDHG